MDCLGLKPLVFQACPHKLLLSNLGHYVAGCAGVLGEHSTEVAFALLTLLPQVCLSMFPSRGTAK